MYSWDTALGMCRRTPRPYNVNNFQEDETIDMELKKAGFGGKSAAQICCRISVHIIAALHKTGHEILSAFHDKQTHVRFDRNFWKYQDPNPEKQDGRRLDRRDSTAYSAVTRSQLSFT